ncbi:hypothetical protein NDR87_10805 [Nocardia sp. CDC159]|uniref:Uncharacterized protein n=1 Tax=Nocardia pulmonis TaxID=2951408 RepID=A0A9X2E5C9_9NOCA|nr:MULTISPECIES: hypothetical protein [Nocardia]MCM6773960.1 hypothetical protein [Nocardia pulmonis]MCM6786847.1 hypothetical protein [Nocardia sp. CDC159]
MRDEDKPRLGQIRRETVAALDFLRWHSQIGKVLSRYLLELPEPEAERNAANIVFRSPEVIDWAAATYALAEHEERPTLPTEVLNADGCRVFGNGTKRGWRGAALAVCCEHEMALDVLAALADGTGEPLCVLLEAELSTFAAAQPAVRVTIGSFRHG